MKLTKTDIFGHYEVEVLRETKNGYLVKRLDTIRDTFEVWKKTGNTSKMFCKTHSQWSLIVDYFNRNY